MAGNVLKFDSRDRPAKLETPVFRGTPFLSCTDWQLSAWRLLSLQ